MAPDRTDGNRTALKRWTRRGNEWRDRLEDQVLHGKEIRWPEKLALGIYWTARAAISSDIMAKSAALSYTVVFSLVPLITTVLAFLTAFPGLDTERENFMGLLSDYLLPGAVQNVQIRLSQFSDRAATAGALSSLIFFVVVLMLFETMERAHNSVWRAERPRTWSERVKTLSFFLMLSALGTTVFVALRNQSAEIARELRGQADPGLVNLVSQLGQFFMAMFTAWVLFVVFIRILPNVKVRWSAALIGGVFAGTIWHFLKDGFTWYVENFGNFENIYGALGVVPVFFLWVYLSFMVLLLGACAAFVAQNLRDRIFLKRAEGTRYPRAFFAVVVGTEVARAFRLGLPPLTQSDLVEELGLPEFSVAEALDWLCQKGVLIAVPTKGENFYTPAKPAESVLLWDIVEGFAGDALEVPGATDWTAKNRLVEEIFREARDFSCRHFERYTLGDVLAEERKESA